MKRLILLLLFCHFASAAKHSLKYFLTATAGVSNLPEFVAVALVDEVEMGYCDSNRKSPEPKTSWMKKVIEENPQHLQWYTSECFHNQHRFRANIESLKQRFNQSEGAHVFQRMNGCEWDDETGDIRGFNQYGYNGEDFITFDMETMTWIAPTPQAVITKHEWDRDRHTNLARKNFVTYLCTNFLKKYVNYGSSCLQTSELPSVSLLQKTPSSPVSCHATGFYSDRAMMFWRKDGEETHEDVEHGEILPNHDGSFQMSVDLDLSSVTPEEWRRYECVFQLSGVNDDLVTKLDKAVIRTNWGKSVIRNEKEKPSNMTIPIIATVVVLAAVIIAVTGFTVYKKKKAKSPPAPADSSPELSEKLNPET